MATTEESLSWEHEEGTFLPFWVLPETCRLEAVGTYQSPEGGPPEPAWKYSQGETSYILTAKPGAPSMLSAQKTYRKCMRILLMGEYDEYLGGICRQMTKVKTVDQDLQSSSAASEAPCPSDVAINVIHTNKDSHLTSAGPSLENQWKAIKLHQTATVAEAALGATPGTEIETTNWFTRYLPRNFVSDLNGPNISLDDGNFRAFESGLVQSGDAEAMQRPRGES